MKKIFTLLSLVMLTALTANAADYRRTWDFTKGWSATTQEICAADSKHWTTTSSGFESKAFSGTVALMEYNGEDIPIPELEGMAVGGCKSAAHVNLYVGKNKNNADVDCLWLNGKKAEDYIEVTVPAGENVKFGYTTHKNGAGRGFKTSSAGFADADGKTTWKTEDGTEIADVEILNSNTEDAVLKLQTTDGAHIYYVIIGDGDAAKSAKVGIMYYEAAGKGFSELPIYNAVKDMEGFSFEGIEIGEANPTAAQMQSYDAIILDGSLPADADLLNVLKENIYWQPVVNLNGDIAAALGFGTKVEGESEIVVVTDTKKNWFAGYEGLDDQTGEGNMGYAVTAGMAFPAPLNLVGKHAGAAKYVVWVNEDGALDNDAVISYVYNSGHNEYIYYGVADDFMEGTEVILQNMVSGAAASKSDISETPAPAVKGAYREMETTVTISCLNKNAVIYYTTDGTEPTIESAVYSDPLVFTTEGNVVKAIAIADGYTVSSTSTYEVPLFHQAKAPVISYEGNGKTENAVITITSDEDVDIYYNFTGSEAIENTSSIYEGPITITTSATITAFAVGKEGVALVQSNAVSQEVFANTVNVRRDVIAKFDPTSSNWGTLGNLVLDGNPMTAWASSNYYFTWGKTATMSYTQVTSEDPMVDPETGDPIVDENGNWIYEVLETTETPASVTTCTADEDWKLVSQGQVIVYQGNGLTKNVGYDGGYNPARAEDMILWGYGTSSDVQLSSKASGDKYTARIESTKKLQAPFNVVVVACTASSGGEQLEVQVSEDGETWTAVGERIVLPGTKRLGTAKEVAYEGENEVYVRLAHVATGSAACIHSITVLNHGEKSAQLEEELTGVAEVEAAPVAVKAVKVLKGGKLIIETANGTFNAAGALVK